MKKKVTFHKNSPVRIGSRIQIVSVFDETSMTASGIDEQAKKLIGKEGVVEQIGGNVLHGTWGSLGVLADKDRYDVIEY